MIPDRPRHPPTGNPRFIAAAVAALIVVKVKSVAWAIVVGMGVLWLLQWVW